MIMLESIVANTIKHSKYFRRNINQIYKSSVKELVSSACMRVNIGAYFTTMVNIIRANRPWNLCKSQRTESIIKCEQSSNVMIGMQSSISPPSHGRCPNFHKTHHTNLHQSKIHRVIQTNETFARINDQHICLIRRAACVGLGHPNIEYAMRHKS